MNALVIDRLTKRFDGLQAVNGISLEVSPGQRRAVLGPNGAGKSTLFNLIGGQLLATSGTIILFGQDITNLAPYKRVSLGVARTFQITNLFPRLTVLENIILSVQGLGLTKFVMHRPVKSYTHIVDEAVGLLERWEIANKKDAVVQNLSHGDQRKVEIVMALAGNPKILLLDEPTAGLSPAESQTLTAIIRNLDPEITVLLIEHDMDVAFEIADWITVLHQGEVVADGPQHSIRNEPHLQEIYFGGGVGETEPAS